MCSNSRCKVKLLLGKLRILLHGEVAVGEISDWGNSVGEVALGKHPGSYPENISLFVDNFLKPLSNLNQSYLQIFEMY